MIDILETQRIKVRRSSWFHLFCIQLLFFVMYSFTWSRFLFICFQVGRKSFYKYILPLGRRWAAHIDLIRWLSQRDMVGMKNLLQCVFFFLNCRWEDRLCPMNHHAYFPVDVTVIWDTTCFRSLIRYMSICSNHDFCVPLGFSGSGSRGTGLMVVMSSMVNEIPP